MENEDAPAEIHVAQRSRPCWNGDVDTPYNSKGGRSDDTKIIAR